MKRPTEAEPRGKIFCVGFQKTGTSTLARALQLLGYSVTGPNFVSDFADKNDLLRKIHRAFEALRYISEQPLAALFWCFRPYNKMKRAIRRTLKGV